ncbi:MAG: hypothetical protein WBO23_18110, partial [Burkholderiales bacterium]
MLAAAGHRWTQGCATFSAVAANHLNPVRQVTVKRATIEQMLETMREFGSHGWEVLVLWLGEVEPGEGKARVI